MRDFVYSYPKTKYQEPKQICFEEAREEIQTGIFFFFFFFLVTLFSRVLLSAAYLTVANLARHGILVQC